MRHALYLLATLFALSGVIAFVIGNPKHATAPEPNLGAKPLTAQQIAAKLTEISQDQQRFAGTKYVQVLEGGVYPEDELRRLNVTIPEGMAINQYVSPQGPGYEVVYNTPTTLTVWAFGPEAADRQKYCTKNTAATATVFTQFTHCTSTLP